MFHRELNILFHVKFTGLKNASSKNTSFPSVNYHVLMQPTLMHYELCFLHVAHACPYDRQSSHSTFHATEISYIWVTQNSHLHVETASPHEGHTSHPSFF